jgi:alpha-L-fucosidase 2
MANMKTTIGIVLAIAFLLSTVVTSQVRAVVASKPDIAPLENSDIVKTIIDWRSFLARHDMVWKRLPGNWHEAAWTGNGMLGSMSWVEDEALRLQVFRGDVQAHRPMTQGFSGFTRARLQIGSFYLKPPARPTQCDLRLSLYDAEVAGALSTGKSELTIRQFTHAEDMVIVTELESVGGAAAVSLSWKPASSMPTRRGYAKTEADFARLREQYISKYPTEVFHPNPDPLIKMVGGVKVCIQDMLGGSRHVTAWKMIKTGEGKQRLAVSVANRWPKETNDPVAEAVAAVSKVCAMDINTYNGWKQKHYDWWHGYYPASFLSVPDTEVETVYWTTMYKLGSATRPDRVMIDTAGIWQTPSKWPDSHWDFNIPYCYYPMPTANRVEMGQSLIRPFNSYQDNLIKNVRPVEWQKDSAFLPVTTGHDLYQPKDIDDRGFQNTGGHLVWGMHACWLIYRGAMDDDMLRNTIYPILRRAANYQIHRLEKQDGKYHAPVSHSPEYGDAPDANYELAMLRWACHAIVAAGTRLKVDATDLAKYRDILANLADYPTDQRGYMVGRGMPFDRPHRHWCHLQMMHPLQLVIGKTLQERELMIRSMNNFDAVNRKSGAAAFTFNGLSAMWALLGDGDRAVDQLHRFMKWPNLCANSMYQEGNNPCFESPVYAAHNVHELLVQCYDEFPASGQMQATIRVFPAVPSTWPGAIFHNLRTMGAFLVSAEHRHGQTQWIRVKSLAGEPCRIIPNLPGPVRLSGRRRSVLHDLGDGIYSLDIEKGEEVLLYTGKTQPTPVIKPLPAQEENCNRYGLR